jgi:hypothetical protein
MRLFKVLHHKSGVNLARLLEAAEFIACEGRHNFVVFSSVVTCAHPAAIPGCKGLTAQLDTSRVLHPMVIRSEEAGEVGLAKPFAVWTCAHAVEEDQGRRRVGG